MVWQGRINVGVKMLSSWKLTLEALSVMCYLPVSLSHISVPFLQVSENNYGRQFGFLISLINKFLQPQVLNPWKFSLLSPWKQDGKMRACLLITCLSKTHQLFHHAQDGLCWSILSCKVQAGLEVLKETICHQSTLTKNIGWDNLQRIFHKVELYC